MKHIGDCVEIFYVLVESKRVISSDWWEGRNVQVADGTFVSVKFSRTFV